MLYNFAIFLFCLAMLPKLVYKKYRSNLLERLGLKLPNVPKRKEGEIRIWIHAVSLGESKAVLPLMQEIKQDFPDAKIFFSSATKTGQEAVRGKGPDYIFFLPLDFSFTLNRLVKGLSPDLFILVETDFWYQLLKNLKKRGTKIALVNGKLSEVSHKRFQKVPFFSKKLFSYIDLFCLQSREYESRFTSLGVPKEKIFTTGNIKFDMKSVRPSSQNLYFPKNKPIITVACTHEGEEESLLKTIAIFPEATILLAPRHPERFSLVASMIEKLGLTYRRISEPGTGNEKVVLIDKMGILDLCYEQSLVAIMGGSFVSHIGGHNIYEPARLGVPVLYGPHMFGQKGIVESLKKYNIGEQVEISQLSDVLSKYFLNPPIMEGLIPLKNEVEGATKRSWNLIKSL